MCKTMRFIPELQVTKIVKILHSGIYSYYIMAVQSNR